MIKPFIISLFTLCSYLACSQSSDSIYVIAETPPEFPGGQTELYNYLAKNIEYPSCHMHEVSETSYISFIIELDGSISTIEVVKSNCTAIENEFVRVMEAMPKWTPASHENRLVRFNYVLPVRIHPE